MSEVTAGLAMDTDASASAASTARADAFRRLADEHLADNYRLARIILSDSADAEDAVHDAYLTAWQKWSTLRDQSRFEAWFGRILVNTCRNRRRRSTRFRVVDVSGELHGAIMAGGDDSAATDRQADLGAAFARVGHDDRIVLALRYYRDLPVDDIGRLLGIPAGTVKSRLHNALRRLHCALGDADRMEDPR